MNWFRLLVTSLSIIMSKTDTEMWTEELEILNKERDALKLKKEQIVIHFNNICYEKDVVSDKLKECEKKIAQIKTSLESKNMFTEEIIANFEDFHLISIDEQTIIGINIDKSDYTRYGRARIMDLEDVINTILRIKKIHPTWKLKSMRNTGRLERLPPQNTYEFTFITQEGFCFNYVGMRIY